MVERWRYRSASVLGTLVLTGLATAVVTRPVVLGLLSGLPVVGRLPASPATGEELLLEIGTTVVVFGLAFTPLYRPRPRRILDTITLAQKRGGLAIVALAALGYFDYTYRLPRLTLIGVAAVSLLVLPLWFVWIRRPAGGDRRIIVGDDPDHMIDLYEATDRGILGFVSPPSIQQLGSSSRSDGGVTLRTGDNTDPSEEPPRRLGGLVDLDRLLVTHDVDTVLLAFAEADRGEFFRVLNKCYEHGVAAKVHREHADHVLVSAATGGPIVDVDLKPLDLQDYVSKRLFDVAFAAAGLVLLSPVVVAIVIAIKLDSPGPVLYSQERTAAFGETFTIYKFRSMVPNAEATTGVRLSEEDSGREDPRVTRVGRVLRRTHLDEIPQLWLVLTGRMSVVGPRPERPRLDARFEADGVNWRRRWFVKPGLTGLAQIHGITGADPERKFRHDIEYIREQSFWFDLKIVLRQLWRVLQDVMDLLTSSE